VRAQHTKEMKVHMFGRNDAVCGARNWCLVSERPYVYQGWQAESSALVVQVSDDRGTHAGQ